MLHPGDNPWGLSGPKHVRSQPLVLLNNFFLKLLSKPCSCPANGIDGLWDIPWESCCSSCMEHPHGKSRSKRGGSSNPARGLFKDATSFGTLTCKSSHRRRTGQSRCTSVPGGRSPPVVGGPRGCAGLAELLTLLSLLVLGRVWLTCRSEYLGGFRKGLLISQGTDSVRTNLAGLGRERGAKGMERRGKREGDTSKLRRSTWGQACTCELPLNHSPKPSRCGSAPALGWQPDFGLP